MTTRSILRSLLTVAGTALPLWAAAGSTGEEFRAPLALYVNEIQKEDVIALVESDEVWLETSSLERAGLTCLLGRERTDGGTSFVALRSLAPNVTYTLDEVAVALRLAVDARCFAPTSRSVRNNRPADITYTRDRSAFLNYGLNGRTHVDLLLALEAGISAGGVLASTQVTGTSSGRFSRGLSQLSFDDREHLRRWVLGDSPVRTDALGAGGYLGGLTVEKRYDLDPYFVPYPSIDLSGTTTTPSTVDVFVNDRLVRREQIPAGAFRLGDLPLPSGSGETRMVITDAFGRAREVNAPYYLATSLLGRGLQEYRYTLGAQRHLGANSWDYGPLAFSASHRLGLTAGLTAGLRLEASRDLVSGGPSMNVRVWRLGELGLSAAASRTPQGRGSAVSLAYSRSGRALSIGGSLRATTDAYATSSTGPADPGYRLQLSAYAGLPLGSRGTLSVHHTVSEGRPSQSLGDTRRRRATSLYASAQLARRASLFLSVGRVEESGRSSPVFSFGLALLPTNRTAVRLSSNEQNGTTSRNLEVQRALTTADGYGYRVGLADGGGPSSATLQYQGRHGRYEAEVDSFGGTREATFRISGGLVSIGGNVFATRPVEGGFALLQVPGVGGVRGYASHQEVGRTNGRGDLLVTNLLPNYGNVLSVDDADLPFDYSLPETRKVVAPPYRGGAVVRFSGGRIHRITGTVHVVNDGEDAIPAYGRLVILSDPRVPESPVGLDGLVYFENVTPGPQRARLEYGGKACELEFVVPDSAEPDVTLGDLSCSLSEEK